MEKPKEPSLSQLRQNQIAQGTQGLKKPARKAFGRFKSLFGPAALAGALAGTLALSGCTFDAKGIPLDTRDAAADSQTPQKDANDGKDVPIIADAGTDALQDAKQDSQQDAAPDAKPWWNTEWQYCRQISITGTFPADYSHGIALNAANFDYSHAKADLADLRFLEGTCETTGATAAVLPAWAETVNTSGDSKIWFMTKTASVPSVAMYYGDSAAAPAFDVSKAFVFGDDYSKDTSGNYDTTGSCSVDTNEKVLKCAYPGVDDVRDVFLKSGATDLSMKNLEVHVKGLATGGQYPISGVNYRMSDANNQYHAYTRHAYAEITPEEPCWLAVSGGLTTFLDCIDQTTYHNQWYEYTLKVYENNHTFMWNGNASSQSTVNISKVDSTITGSGLVGLRYYAQFGYFVEFSDLRVRNYVSPEPSCAVGAEKKYLP